MEEQKFELGPKQKEWLQALRDNPKQQHRGSLGKLKPNGTIGMCCLMKYASLNYEEDNEWRVSNAGRVCIGTELNSLPYQIWTELGLRSGLGESSDNGIQSLSSMNDNGVTWPQIADHIEANPHQYFTKSI